MPLACISISTHTYSQMDSRLFEAAKLGDVVSLNTLLEEDPFILEKSALALTAETPLHIAAFAGKADFVREIIRRKISFGWELNRDGFSPLHIAVAIGYEDVVQELLSFGIKEDVGTTYYENSSRLCLLRDKQGLIPLHYAAMKGRVAIIEELVRCCPESLKEPTTRGQTVLHLAVKNSQFEAFKTLVEKLHDDDVKNFVNAEDEYKNTIHQMAVASKQLQVRDYLERRTLEIVSGDQLEESTDAMPQATESPQPKQSELLIEKVSSNTLMRVLAGLLATAAFETARSPPDTITSAIDRAENCSLAQMFSSDQICNAMRVPILFMVTNSTGFFTAIFLFFIGSSKSAALYLLPSCVSCLIFTYIVIIVVMFPVNSWIPAVVVVVAGVVSVSIILLPLLAISLLTSMKDGDKDIQEIDMWQPLLTDTSNVDQA